MIRRIITFILINYIILFGNYLYAQNSVGIGTTNPNQNAVLHLVSPNNNQGLIIPIVNNRNSISTIQAMLIYDSSDGKLYFGDGANWIEVGGSVNGDNWGNQVVETSGPLQGDGTNGNPLKLIDGNQIDQVLVWNGTQWQLQELSSGTSYVAGTGINITGSTISNTGDTDASDDIINTSISGGDISGTFGNLKVNAIQNRNVLDINPIDGDVLKWNNSNSRWEPGSDLLGTGTTLPTLTNGQIITSNGANNPVAVTPTGDVNMDNSGSFSVNRIGGIPLGISPSVDGQVMLFNDGTGTWDAGTVGGSQNLDDVLSVGNSAGTKQIRDLQDPTVAQDAATKNYVDNNSINTVNVNGTTVLGDGNTTPLSINVGTGANQIVQLDAGGLLPAIDGSQLTNLPTSVFSTNNTIPKGNGTTLVASNIADDGTLIYLNSNTRANGMVDVINTNSTSEAIKATIENVSSSLPALATWTDGTGPSLIVDHGNPSTTDLVYFQNQGNTVSSINDAGYGWFEGGLETSGFFQLGDISLAPGITTDRLYNVSGNLFWNGTNLTSGGSFSTLNTIPKGDGSGLSASIITDDGTNVGISNPTPSEKLDVNGNIKFSNALMPNDLPGTAGQILTSQGVGVAPTWTTVSGVTNYLGSQGGTNYSISTNPDNLLSSVIGNSNILYGNLAGDRLTSGGNNVAIGQQALENTLTGTKNVAVGSSSLRQNTASDNVAVGFTALQGNTTGGNNVAVGGVALIVNGTGNGNTAVGIQALEAAVNRSDNTAIGYQAGTFAITGNRNTFIGMGADAGVANITNATAIGANAIVSNTDRMVLGAVGTDIQFDGELRPGNNPGTAGQVLTSQGTNVTPTWTTPTQKIAFRANLENSNQPIPVSTITTVNFDAEEYDFGNGFNTTTDVYTVPVTGLYYLYARVFLNQSVSGRSRIWIQVNSANVTGDDQINFGASLDITLMIQLTAGDLVRIRYDCDEATTIRGFPVGPATMFFGYLVF